MWGKIALLLWQHRHKLVAACAAVMPFVFTAALVLFTALTGAGTTPAAAVLTPQCQQQLQAQGVSADPGVSFGAGPVANGKAVIATGAQMKIPEKGIIIALATAMQESSLRNLANPNVAESMSIPHEGVGHDHLSVGIFQQQPWWGTIRDLMTPGVAARKFYDALLKVGGWLNMAPTVAAQSVQRSAFPDAYADDVAAATVFYRNHVREVLATSGAPAPPAAVQDDNGRDVCGALLDPDAAAPLAESRPGTAIGVAAARAAERQIGLPYVWGGGSLDGPTGGGFDCSGLVRYAIYQASGHRIVLPRVTWDMARVGRLVPRNAVQPGDLVFLNPEPNPQTGAIGPGHVQMVVNPTTVVEASTFGVPVKLTPFPTNYMAIKRVL